MFGSAILTRLSHAAHIAADAQPSILRYSALLRYTEIRRQPW